MIKHIKIEQPGWLSDEPNVTEDLLYLGSVYLNKIRILEDKKVFPGDYVRIHTTPKRFDTTKFTIESILIHECENFVVLDKPSGIPVHATLDNNRENLLQLLQTTKQSNYYVTSRLDVETSGLIIYAKSKDFLKQFNRKLQVGHIKKFYEAQTNSKIPLGLHTHYMKKSPRAPKVVVKKKCTTLLKCELRVLSCKQVNNFKFKIDIELLTGRTHQIRTQLSFLKAPIIGDTLYGGIKNDAFFLKCKKIEFDNYSFNI